MSTCLGLAVGLSNPAAAESTTQLQYNLAGLAYLPFVGVDGQSGPQTEGATRAFQTDACIAVDGVDGPQTDAAFAAKVSAVQGAAGAGQDGAYGPNTKDAVAAWQGAHGLTADGAAGPDTMAAMGIARTCGNPPVDPPVLPPGSMIDNIVNIAHGELNNTERNHEVGGYNCNFYSTQMGSGTPCSNGFLSEEWCADFAEFVWGQAGVNTGGLNPLAASFYDYGHANGTYHQYGPQPGDAVTFWDSEGYIGHVGLVVAVNGDDFSYISGNTSGADGSYTVIALKDSSAANTAGFSSPVG